MTLRCPNDRRQAGEWARRGRMWHLARQTAACQPGFSLLELLVVVVTIGLLAALLLPTLSGAKAEARRISCQGNLRQLALASQVYSADNDGSLANNNPGSTNDWVRGNLLVPREATNTAPLRQGKLFPYANHPGTYHCPSDLSQTNGAPRVRSYSMNGWIGSRVMEAYSAQRAFRTFNRDSELAAAGGANIFLIFDEHEASINDAWLLITMDDSHPFASFPATRHDLGYNLTFADGHVEWFRLRDPGSLRMGGDGEQISPQNLDWQRLKGVTTLR